MTDDAPQVGIIMGSDSDLPIMREAADALAEFGVTHEVRVISAHRTPQAMLVYGERAAERGLRVIIAGAGGAAALPGMVASATSLPVIGVPVPLKHLEGMDSLLSIVQMPAGIPVADRRRGQRSQRRPAGRPHPRCRRRRAARPHRRVPGVAPPARDGEGHARPAEFSR